ncbi:MAG: HEAT repeat domain-containing protein, partial [Planctomycetota bacterium]
MRRAGWLLALVLLAPSAKAQSPYSERTIEELVKASGHANPAVRIQAVDELALRRGPEALVALLKRLKDEEAAVRARAADALRVHGDERAVPHLAQALEDPDAAVRRRCVLSLGTLGGRYLVPTLVRRIQDRACIVRAAAVSALGEIGDPLSLDAVLGAQRSEKEDLAFSVTAAALIAAAKIGGRAGFGASLEIAEPKLARSWLVRASAAHGAGIAGDESRLPLLKKLLSADADPRVCQAAARALAKLGAHGTLAAALGLEDAFRRRAAVTGLAEAAGKKVDAALIKASKDRDAGVVLEAGAALLGRGRAEAFPVLIALLDSAEPSVWLGALEVLDRRTGL